MPKGFSEHEKVIIRRKLGAVGREHFEKYGIKKTNIEELTRAVGISKGAFYLFYNSKEELFFEILVQFETETQATLLQAIAQSAGPPRQRFKHLVQQALSGWKNHPLLRNFDQAAYEYLFRKLPEEKAHQLLHTDDIFAERFVAQWRQVGVEIDADPRMVAGLLRAIFFVSLHQDDFNQEIYPELINLLTDLITEHLVATAHS